MDADNSGKATVEPSETAQSDGGSTKKGNGANPRANHTLKHKVSTTLTHNNEGRSELLHDKLNDCNVAFMSQAVTDMHQQESDLRPNTFESSKSGVGTKKQEFNIQLEAINAELARSESIEESIIAPNKSNLCVAVISQSEDHLKESRDHQKTARVPNAVSQGRVLPTWT
nr:hypothetical protein CFP56_50195 [Quercus suber]